ncbi:hypothetical protein Syun_022882 [Stephania yunnanensis]|uniref:Uncharacterized protein n=1 Tax=Stephania yunnanensis TaxID=152371 RepID=A0AAP0F8R9_9MAGN
MSDVALGFGVAAKGTQECRRLDPNRIVVLHQGDIGEYHCLIIMDFSQALNHPTIQHPLLLTIMENLSSFGVYTSRQYYIYFMPTNPTIHLAIFAA